MKVSQHCLDNAKFERFRDKQTAFPGCFFGAARLTVPGIDRPGIPGRHGFQGADDRGADGDDPPVGATGSDDMANRATGNGNLLVFQLMNCF